MKRIGAVLGSAVVLVLVLLVQRRSAGVPPASGFPAPAQRQAGGPHHTAAAPRIDSPERHVRIARSQRNLFAYYEAPRVIAPAPAPEIVTAAAPQPVIETPPARIEPTPPPFPYRYIGRFGPRHDPIAAFVGADRIVTARPGDRIDEQFVLRAIGLESVEVEARGWEERIPVALSAEI